MLNAIDILFSGNIKVLYSDLYSRNGQFYLSLGAHALPSKTRVLLSEYGTIFDSNIVTRSVLNESSIVIRQQDAVSYIGKYICKHK